MSFLFIHVISIPNSLRNTRQCTLSVYNYDWSSIFLNHCSLLMYLYFCGFLTSIKIKRFIFLVFNSIFTSDPLLLQLYCRQFPCCTLPFLLHASFSLETFHGTHLVYATFAMLDVFRTSAFY